MSEVIIYVSGAAVVYLALVASLLRAPRRRNRRGERLGRRLHAARSIRRVA